MTGKEYKPLQQEYSRLSSRYDSRWRDYVIASVQATLQRLDLTEGNRILDIGCGTGVLLAELSRAVPNAALTGIDMSAEMLDVARQRLGRAADLRQAAAESLPFDDAEFDVVISTSVFHFIRQPVEALHEIRRVLQENGKLVITDWCDDYLLCRLCDLLLRLLNPAHYRTYSTDELGELLNQAGFKNIVIERYKIGWLWGMMTAQADKG